jgi:hypothetical protein
MFIKFLKGCLVALLVSIGCQSVAEEKPFLEGPEAFNPYQYGMYSQQFPAVCGEYEFVTNLLKTKGFEIVSASIGRVGAHPEGEPVFLILIYRKDDQMMMTMETPQQAEKCIMFLTFNTIEVPQEGTNERK